METLRSALKSVQGDKLLLAWIFVVMLGSIFLAQRFHNETLIQWLLQTAGQVLAALLALLVHDSRTRSTDQQGDTNVRTVPQNRGDL